MADFDIHELWDEPWEGLPEEDAAWEWDLINEEENGETKILEGIRTENIVAQADQKPIPSFQP